MNPIENPSAPAESTRDPERTKALILDAARAEFARNGFSGARVDQITARAECNKRMLYYYFGSKEDLFLAVLESAFADLRAAEQSLRLDNVEPLEGIRKLITFVWDYYLHHPDFLTLLNSENLHQARHLKTSSRLGEMDSPLVPALNALLVRGQQEGTFRADTDATQLYLSIAALSYYYLSSNHTLSAISARNLLAPKARAERLHHMIDLVLGFLRPQPL